MLSRESDSPSTQKQTCEPARSARSNGDEPLDSISDSQLLRALLERVSDSIYFKDLRSRFLRCSQSLADKTKHTKPEDLIGKTDFDIFDHDHAVAASTDEKRIMKTGQPLLNFEEKEIWDNGTEQWVSTTKFPLISDDGSIIGTFGVSRDITKQKFAEAQVIETAKLESIGRLAAGVAHEINTPSQFISDNLRFLAQAMEDLQAVLEAHNTIAELTAAHPDFAGAIQRLKAAEDNADLGYLLEEIPKTLQQSLEGVGRISRIVGSLKEFAHPGSPDPAPANLNRAIATAINISRHEWKYVANVKTDFDSSMPSVPCIVDQFNQVILNLIVNAAHAIEDQTTQDGVITVRTRHDDRWAIIEVQDNGCGVPEKIRREIFQPFFTTKKSGRGTGQGLALVQKFVISNHGGLVELDSSPGKGSTFRIKLPLTVAKKARMTEEATAA